MKTISTLALVASVLAGAARAQPVATLLPVQSEIVFTSQQMGVPVEGRFKKFDARIALDPKHPETGSVALRVDTGSATLGLPDTDAELAKPNWFATAKFPHATFRSSAFKSLGGGKFEVSGKLAIKGNVHDVIVPLLVTQSGGTSTATGSFTIKRLEYKIGDGEWADTSLVANDVQVHFKLALSGLPPP